ncbi:PrgI family protein [Patescibacteria group bacterium]|nr:PrgI family protein [Patescibacteria group bacterium]MBU1757707.1 PrgI family protein [Patescibacteria group bacterium]
MTFQIGPISLSIIQLFLLAIGVAAALGIYNSFSKTGAKAAGILLAILVFVIFIAVAFFKISEMGLLAFLAKMIRNKFFDTTKKYQINYEKDNPTDIQIKESKSKDEKATVENKESKFDKQIITDIKEGGLI